MKKQERIGHHSELAYMVRFGTDRDIRIQTQKMRALGISQKQIDDTIRYVREQMAD